MPLILLVPGAIFWWGFDLPFPPIRHRARSGGHADHGQAPAAPDAAMRAQMLQPIDVAETIAFVLSLPKRAAIPELVILPAALQTLGKTS